MHKAQSHTMLLGAVCLVAVLIGATSIAETALSVEKGWDVGEKQVLLSTPYNPAEVDEVTFVAPTPDYPLYEVVVPLGNWTEGKHASVTKVLVNDVPCEAVHVFTNGESHVTGNWITKGDPTADNVVVAARSLWHNNEAVTVSITISAESEIVKTFEATAPAKGGGLPGWRRYQSVALHEPVGVARECEPVEFSLTARAENCGDLEKELRVCTMDPATGDLVPVPFQTFNAQEFPGTPKGTSSDNYLYHPSRSIDAVFLANVDANDAKVYVALYDNPDAAPPEPVESDLTVTGDPIGAVIENRFYKITLDEHCGQIGSFELKGRDDDPVPPLTNCNSAAAHWNPDSYTDNGKWGHTYAWDPPEETVVTTRGPLMFRVTNSGRMPGYTPQIRASVSYSFYASVPYVKVSTVVEVCDDTNVSAIRNGEIVLDSHLATHFVWQEKCGALRQVRTLHGPNYQDEWAARVDHDVSWIALTHEDRDYGLGSIIEASVAFDALRGEAAKHRTSFYLYAHHNWGIPLTYFTRAWVYPFSDYQRGPILPVKAGSTYVERMAFLPFLLEDGDHRYDAIQTASKIVHNPLVQRWGR